MSTPEGWYPSQTNPNEEAHWDGTKWTGETRPVTPPAAAELGPDQVVDGRPVDVESHVAPVKRRFPLWALIGVPVVGVVIIAAVIIAVLVAIPAANEENAKTVAIAMCKQKTLDQLKAPATAKFGPMKPVDLSDAVNAALADKGETPTAHPRKDGAQAFIFSSYVDAENGFGALVRNDVSCIITVKDGKADEDSVALVTSKD